MNDATTPVALVTGSARRIGAAIVREFHSAGYHVIVHCHQSVHEGQRLVDALNGARPRSAHLLQADLTDHDAVLALGRQALRCAGRLDVLVNNASRFHATPLGESTLRQWHELIDSNARSAWFLVQSLAPALQESRGSIVNLVDINTTRGMAGFGPYTMAKSALEAMTRTLARELAPRVRVNAVAPGAILWPESMDDSPDAVREQNQILAGIPARRLGSEQEVAAAVLFLAHTAHYITGQTLRVDGGRALT